MLNNIVDNIEQCGQHNIVQGCFHQPGPTCAFFCRVPQVAMVTLTLTYITIWIPWLELFAHINTSTA